MPFLSNSRIKSINKLSVYQWKSLFACTGKLLTNKRNTLNKTKAKLNKIINNSYNKRRSKQKRKLVIELNGIKRSQFVELLILPPEECQKIYRCRLQLFLLPQFLYVIVVVMLSYKSITDSRNSVYGNLFEEDLL